MEGQNLTKKSGVAVAAFVCGLVAMFCCNPLYLVSLAAMILGIVGLATKKKPIWMSVIGLCLGVGSVAICIIVDICLIPFTMGTSFLF